MRNQAVGMRQGDLFGTFLAMNSDIAHFDLHMERDNVEAANFGAAAVEAAMRHHPPTTGTRLVALVAACRRRSTA